MTTMMMIIMIISQAHILEHYVIKIILMLMTQTLTVMQMMMLTMKMVIMVMMMLKTLMGTMLIGWNPPSLPPHPRSGLWR